MVGIGASAGGLEAFSQLLELLPPDTGMAFVLIQHLDPKHASYLPEALLRISKMPVDEVQDAMEVRPDHVYVMPPNSDMVIAGGRLALSRRDDRARLHLPIDSFLRSLASERTSQAIGVILSGTASDGTEGLRAIRAEGGITLVQEPSTAKFAGMPRSAIDAGVVDRSLPLPELVAELVRLSCGPYTRQDTIAPSEKDPPAQVPARLLALLREVGRVDFGEYKPATLTRRLERRMALLRMENLEQYIRYAEENREEARLLTEDVLIHVTSFFRDPAVFEALKEEIFPKILEHKLQGDPIRIWVPGCSSGEEAYSVAIALLEFLATSEATRNIGVQIFGSDVSDKAIEKARAGLYPEAALREMTPERVKRYFTRAEGGGYRINTVVRDLCVFVRHDLARDPPFSKLDLVTCRNVLIYFDQPLQHRVLSTFHYCLNQPGFLLLGRSESISGFAEFFSPESKQHKVFSRTANVSTLRFSPSRAFQSVDRTKPDPVASLKGSPTVDVGKHVDNLLLAHYAPPGVIVNGRMEILEFRGRTGPFLEPAPGQPQHSLPKMLREGLLSDVRIAFEQARTKRTAVRRERVQVRQSDGFRECAIVVTPISGLPGAKDPLFMVLFEEPPRAAEKPGKGKSTSDKRKPGDGRRAVNLEHELVATKEYLNALVDDHQRTNDELTAANEELVSSNEELQSLNEELETAKEELQSSNEELTTVNDEMRNRNEELNTLSNDVVNVLASVNIPIIIVDRDRHIRRFTPKARGMMNLLASDIGRPIEDIRPNIRVPDLGAIIAETIDGNAVREREVQDHDGRWHRMQVRPYKTSDNRIDGAILSLTDIDALKQTVGAAELSRDYFAGVLEAVPLPLVVVVDNEWRALTANQAFSDTMCVSPLDVSGKALFEICGGVLDLPALRAALTATVEHDTPFHGLEVELQIDGAIRTLSTSANSTRGPAGERLVIVALQDVSERKRGEVERARLLLDTQEAKTEAERANAAKDLFLAVLSHELRTPLSTMLIQTQRLLRNDLPRPKLDLAIQTIERALKMQAQLIDDLLDVARIASGKLKLQPQTMDLGPVVATAIDAVSSLAERKSITIEATLPDDDAIGTISGDPTRLRQVVWNLLSNAIKYTPEGGRVTLTLDGHEDQARIQVSDTGRGLDPELLPHIFERWIQAESVSTRAHGGLGLGLAIVKNVVEAHGGTVFAQSPGLDQGATFTVLLPLLHAGEHGLSDVTSVEETPDVREIDGGSSLRGVRVLIVDDDAGLREVIAEILAEEGAVVWKSPSAADARGVMTGFKPQVLLSDMAMPGEDGVSLLKGIRADGYTIPAVALSGLASAEDRRRALSAGFETYLTKPINAERLTGAVVAAAARR